MTMTMADDPSGVFHVATVPEPGFLDRLRGRAPRDASFIEIRNILATTEFDAIRESDIAVILAKAKVSPREVSDELSAIFVDAVLALTADRDFTEADHHALLVLKRAFKLTDAEADAAVEQAVATVYQRAFDTALAGHFTSADKERLDQIAKALRLSDERARELYSIAAHAALQSLLNSDIAGRTYSASDELHLQQLADSLGAKLQIDLNTTTLLARLRLLGDIEAGNLPRCDVPFMLQRGEVCHSAILGVVYKEMRTVTQRINYSGPTISIPIIKHVRWRFGSIAYQKVTRDEMTELDHVDLYITSKKIFLKGSRANTSIPLTKVVHFTVYRDGLKVEKESGKDVYLLGSGDWEVTGACLDAAARKAHA